ncbi:unnamed protein product [Brachionus calyciflorus]|uniref:Uncharacterized protein n=1 Tax=Brachionus calyciflorus TaxID=104777 RepID=A0A814CWE6_9BILA|nr:unnamed protein product [Brachionus calyciflorus]
MARKIILFKSKENNSTYVSLNEINQSMSRNYKKEDFLQVIEELKKLGVVTVIEEERSNGGTVMISKINSIELVNNSQAIKNLESLNINLGSFLTNVHQRRVTQEFRKSNRIHRFLKRITSIDISDDQMIEECHLKTPVKRSSLPITNDEEIDEYSSKSVANHLENDINSEEEESADQDEIDTDFSSRGKKLFQRIMINNETKNLEAFYVNQLDKNLEQINSTIFTLFSKKWSGCCHRDRCFDQKCCKVIGTDGNYKINRLKFMYSM